MENTDKVLRIVEELERKYNAENDIVPGQPVVHYADRQLAEAVRLLLEVVVQQEQRIKELEQ